jgi:hypothetical protein
MVLDMDLLLKNNKMFISGVIISSANTYNFKIRYFLTYHKYLQQQQLVNLNYPPLVIKSCFYV